LLKKILSYERVTSESYPLVVVLPDPSDEWGAEKFRGYPEVGRIHSPNNVLPPDHGGAVPVPLLGKIPGGPPPPGPPPPPHFNPSYDVTNSNNQISSVFSA